MKHPDSQVGPRSPAREGSPLLALVLTFSIAQSLEGSRRSTRPPERDLWIEVVSCSDQVLRKMANEFFIQAARRPGADWTGYEVSRATAPLREKPGVLIAGS